ncbi:MAG: hypothetical protein MI749_18620, partial [Desulfovibrionales bacterium]|nr:hypothetical protein [Desulfovibrionales bacterium]
RPGQDTITGLIVYNWKHFGLPGMTTSLISANSRHINMNKVLEYGDLDYYLTGKEEYHETLLDVRYSWTEGMLDGLNFRIVGGMESGQAELEGFGAFLTYDKALF